MKLAEWYRVNADLERLDACVHAASGESFFAIRCNARDASWDVQLKGGIVLAHGASESRAHAKMLAAQSIVRAIQELAGQLGMEARR